MPRAVVLTLGVLAACNSAAGLDTLVFDTTSTSTTTSSAGGGGGQGGEGGAPVWPPWLEDRAFRRRIDLLPQIAEPVASFPIAVLLASDQHLADHASADARDLVFTRGDGTTPLSHDVELYEPASGRLAAWVLVPELGPASSIYLYYGSTTQEAPHDGSGVWSDGFAGVWHMADDFTASPVLVRDASGAEHHGIPATADPTQTDGPAGRALVYDTAADRVDIADPPDGSLDFVTASFSLSCWVHVTSPISTLDSPLSHDESYRLHLGLGSWSLSVGDGATDQTTAYGDLAVFQGRWVHLVGVIDRHRGEARAYADGIFRASVALTGLAALGEDGFVRFGSGPNPYLGLLDEVRIYDRALSDAWIAAEHRVLSDPASIVAVGDAEAAP